MSKKLLVITGSARPNSVNKNVVESIKNVISAKQSVDVSVADLAEMNLPFFDAPMSPSAEGFVIEHESVRQWSDMVKSAAGVVFVMPEYNHSMTAIQKNAIDWLSREWNEKPAAIVAYGAYKGKHVLEAFDMVNAMLKISVVDPIASFQLGEAIGWDGQVADEPAVKLEVERSIDALIESI